jgi:hypothetical protein
MDVTIKLRVPILEAHEETHVETFVAVQAWPRAGPSAEERHDNEEEERLERALTLPSQASDPFEWDGDARAQHSNPERFVSMSVLAMAGQEWTAAGVAAASTSAEALEHANTMLRRVHIKTFQITSWVQAGNCTKAEYIEHVRKAMEEERALALHFKTAGNKEVAMECLRRFKLMKSEIENAAEQEEEQGEPEQQQQQQKHQQQQQDREQDNTKGKGAAQKASPPVQEKNPTRVSPPPPSSSSGAPAAAAVAAAPLGPHHSIDLIFSVAVLDWEMGLCDKGQGGDDPAGRKMELQLKKQTMMMAIEHGQMELHEYAGALKQSIANDRALAKKFMAAGNKKEAGYLLMRAKCMEREMEG